MIEKDGLVVILVDMQEYFLQNIDLLKRAKIINEQIKVIWFCIKNNIPIVVLEYRRCGPTINQLLSEIKKVPINKFVLKDYDNGFDETGLEEILNDLGGKNLLFMGVNANVCVRLTAEGALIRNFKIISSDDLITGPKHQNDHTEWYIKNGVYFNSTEELLKTG